jgi:GNAT superfamily N-acetyltransferase
VSLLLSCFAAALVLATASPRGRRTGPDEEILAVDEAQLNEVIDVCDAAHGAGTRTAPMLAARLQQGCRVFLLRKAERPASVLWLALGCRDVYPLRLRVNTFRGAGYLFDGATAPEFRRQGMLGALMRFAWDEEQLTAAGGCIRTDNRDSLMATGKLGFVRTHTVSFVRSALVLRRHEVLSELDDRARSFWSTSTVWRNPRSLECDLRTEGFRDFRFCSSFRPGPRPAGPTSPLASV